MKSLPATKDPTVDRRVDSISEMMFLISLRAPTRASTSPTARGTTAPVTTGTTVKTVVFKLVAILVKEVMMVGAMDPVTSDPTVEARLCETAILSAGFQTY